MKNTGLVSEILTVLRLCDFLKVTQSLSEIQASMLDWPQITFGKYR